MTVPRDMHGRIRENVALWRSQIAEVPLYIKESIIPKSHLVTSVNLHLFFTGKEKEMCPVDPWYK